MDLALVDGTSQVEFLTTSCSHFKRSHHDKTSISHITFLENSDKFNLSVYHFLAAFGISVSLNLHFGSGNFNLTQLIN